MESLLLLPFARQRLLEALALGLPPSAALPPSLLQLLPPPAPVPKPSLTPSPPLSREDVGSSALSPEWTPQEDAQLKSLIREHGTSRWSRVAMEMGSKSNRQCRRRWQAMLNSIGQKGSWSAEEDAKLMEGHKRYGNRWTYIARMVPGRTDNAVKNRFAALMAKNEDARQARSCKWSDALVSAKPEQPTVLETHSTPASSASAGLSSSSPPKRKATLLHIFEVVQPDAAKRPRGAGPLDLNLEAGGEECGWLAACSAEEDSEGSCTDTAESASALDLNTPAAA